MDSHGVKVDTVVFEFLRPRLKEYREQTADLKLAVAGSIAKVVAAADEVVSERRRRLKSAVEAYESCMMDPDANCSGYRRQMELAEGKLEEARRGRLIIERAQEVFRHAQIRHDTVVDEQLLRSAKIVREADERTQGYQRSVGGSPSVTLLSGVALGGGATFGGAASSGGSGGVGLGATAFGSADAGAAAAPTTWRDVPGVTVPGTFPAGFALVPVVQVTDTDPVKGPQDFDAGQDLPTLKWSANALLDVVLPALTRTGATADSVREALRERDVREGLSGERTYSRTYGGFFADSSAMKVGYTAASGFDLQNGRHRLWLLKRLGVDSIPVRVSGGAR